MSTQTQHTACAKWLRFAGDSSDLKLLLLATLCIILNIILSTANYLRVILIEMVYAPGIWVVTNI